MNTINLISVTFTPADGPPLVIDGIDEYTETCEPPELVPFTDQPATLQPPRHDISFGRVEDATPIPLVEGEGRLEIPAFRNDWIVVYRRCRMTYAGDRGASFDVIEP